MIVFQVHKSDYRIAVNPVHISTVVERSSGTGLQIIGEENLWIITPDFQTTIDIINGFVKCNHEAFEGKCIHCNAKLSNGRINE